MSWFSLALCSAFLFGAQNFCYKIAAERDLNSDLVTYYFILTSVLAIWVAVILIGEPPVFSYELIVLSVVDALAFYITTVTRIEALKRLPAGVAFPLIRMSTVLVFIFSVVYFKDSVKFYHIVALALAIFVVHLASKRTASESLKAHWKAGLLFAMAGVLTSGVTNVCSKFAALLVSIPWYMALANTMILIFSAPRYLHQRRKHQVHGPEILLGTVISVFNLGAWWLYLVSLKTGPLSLVAVIGSFGFLIPILLSVVVYKEELNRNRYLAIVLAFVAIVLLRF